MRAVHQFVPMLHRGDAVGEHTLGLRAELRRAGVASEIFVERHDAETESITRDAESYPGLAGPDDLLVYQLATASDLAPWLARRGEPLVVNYHNVTPAPFFASWDNGLARHQVRAEAEMHGLAGRAVLGVAVSEFNRADLVAAGYRRTEVVPPIVGLGHPGADGAGGPLAGGDRPDRGDGPGDRGRGDPAAGWRWLHVGRLAPNKAIEQVITALLLHRASHDRRATLTVVGRPSVPVYAEALRAYAADLGLAAAVEFRGRLSGTELAGAYRRADVVVVASEHEGFCLPAVEAMAQGIPVVAFARGALPEVLGPGGVLVEPADPRALSEAVARLREDPAFRRETVAAGGQRVGALGLATAAERLAGLLLGIPAAAATEPGNGESPSGSDHVGDQADEAVP